MEENYAKLSIVKTLKYAKLSMEENYSKLSIVKT